MIDKLCLTLIVISCFFNASAAEKIVQGNRQLDRNTATLTAKLLLVKLRQAAGQYQVDPSSLYRKMQQTPAQYTNSTQSRLLLKQAYSKKLKNIYASQAEQLLNDLQQRTVDKKLFTRPFCQQATVLDSKNLQLNLKNVFPKIYQQARRKVYLEQRKQIVGKLFPSVTEIDSLSSRELRQRLVLRIVKFQKFPVYEENFEFIRKSIIDPVIKNALQQRAMQLKIIRMTKLDNEWLPAGFSTMIKQNLSNLIAVTRRSDKATKVYGIFPSVEKKIPEVAKSAALDKFACYLLQVQPQVEQKELVATILKSPKANRTANQSLGIFLEKFKEQTISTAVNQYIINAPVTTQPQLREFLINNVKTSKSCNASLMKVFNSKCLKLFYAARATAAARQFNELFPRLADLSWTPAAEAIQQYYKTNKKTFLRKPLNQPGIAEGKIDQQQLLSETSALVRDNIGYIFSNGRRALAGQYKIVKSTAEEIEQTLKSPGKTGPLAQLLSVVGLGSDNASVINEEQLYAKFLQQVTEQWTTSRIKLTWLVQTAKPANVHSKYQSLFPEVKIRIRMLTKAMIKNQLDALNLEINRIYRR
jgi:hypothetical protein